MSMFTLKKIFTLSLLCTAVFVTQVLAETSDGIIRIKSNHDVNTTIERLKTALETKGMTIFKHVDHSAGAKNSGLNLRPTELLIFGNPKVGTPLMKCSQTAALDLPQKALAYKDTSGQVWLLYNDPAYMAARHHIKDCDKAINKVSNALANFTKIATQ